MRLGDVLKFVPTFQNVEIWKGTNVIARYRSKDEYGDLRSDIPTDLDNEMIEAIFASNNTLSIAIREFDEYIR